MRFPETERQGTDAHKSAVTRLESARSRSAEASTAADEARGSAREAPATRELDLARDDEAARARWLDWVERGV